MKKFEVWEDNGGGLSLFTFDESGRCDYCHYGYEEPALMKAHELAFELDLIRNNADPAADYWEGNCGGYNWEYGDDPQALYEATSDPDCHLDMIADQDGIYPERMGFAGKEAFGITEDGSC